MLTFNIHAAPAFKTMGEVYEMVYGVRENVTLNLHSQFAKLFYWLMGKLTKIDIPNNAGDFRLLNIKSLML